MAKSLSKSSYSEKNNYYKEANNPKKELFKTSSCSEETAAPKSNCYVEVVTVKKYEEVASPKKNCLEKCIYKRNVARREIAIWKKKSQMNLVLTFSLRFSPRGSFILINIHGEYMGSIHFNTCWAKSVINSIGPFQSPTQGLKPFFLAA